MTTLESLPAYAQAESAARLKGVNITDLVNAYLAGFAAGASSDETLDDDDDYTDSRVLPGESVYATPDDTRAHFMGLLDEVRHGV
ncbi:hypothetical protein [Bifidobacterium catulorum]|uniref:hypothetical protein n=1 Tax=Bifidobacterium catulorum TaxID=1630173 RepID=UPI001304A865|nr:hypothetical protein [Bifidobacterium catulorum]